MKNFICVLSILLLFAFAANAQEIGFTGPTVTAVSVADALKLRDDSPVILQGNIVKSLGNERYTFSDGTGKITLEIDAKIWAMSGISVNDKEMVQISGEIDRENPRKIEVDVKNIIKI